MDKEDIKSKIIGLRDSGLTYQKIGDTIGRSKSFVACILKEAGYKGHFYPDILHDPGTFKREDEEIAKQLGISVSRIVSIRRKLGIKRKRAVNMNHRRLCLIEGLFPGYVPGSNFVGITSFIIQNLTSTESSRMIDFYLSSKDGLSRYSRFARSKAKSKLASCVDEVVIGEMVDERVICQRD